jgi:hypothetical protein
MSYAAEPNDDGLLEFFRKNVPAPGCADLFLLGHSSPSRNVSIAALLRMFRKSRSSAAKESFRRLARRRLRVSFTCLR